MTQVNEGRSERMSELENILGVGAMPGHNRWDLAGYKAPEVGTQSSKKGVRFILKDGRETVLVTARTLLRVVADAEKKYESVNGCVLEFDCSGEGLGRSYKNVKCEKFVQETNKSKDVEAFI